MSTSSEVTSEQEKLSKAKERAQDQLLAEVAAFVLEDDDGRPDEPGWFTGNDASLKTLGNGTARLKKINEALTHVLSSAG